MQAADELSVSTRARLVRAQANFAFVQGDYANARVLAAEAAAAFRQLGVPVDAVWLQGLEAIAAQYHGDVTQARQLLENALRVARPLKHDWTIAWMVRNLAVRSGGLVQLAQPDAEQLIIGAVVKGDVV